MNDGSAKPMKGPVDLSSRSRAEPRNCLRVCAVALFASFLTPATSSQSVAKDANNLFLTPSMSKAVSYGFDACLAFHHSGKNISSLGRHGFKQEGKWLRVTEKVERFGRTQSQDISVRLKQKSCLVEIDPSGQQGSAEFAQVLIQRLDKNGFTRSREKNIFKRDVVTKGNLSLIVAGQVKQRGRAILSTTFSFKKQR